MTIGYILILSILLLGGVLATAGDRIGTKVGKARLSLFKLRPKKTATVITILTGVAISGTTLLILFTTSKPLRKGVFEYDQTQAKLRETRKELERANDEKTQVVGELNRAREDQSKAQSTLDETNQSLQLALKKLDVAIAEQASKESRLQIAQQQLSETIAQKQSLQQEIEARQAERQALIEQLEQGKTLIAEQNQQIEERNRTISQKSEEIAQTNRNLSEKAEELSRKDQELAAKEKNIADKNLELDEKTITISKKNEEIDRKNLEIQQRNAEIKAKIQEIEYKNQVISEQENKYKQLEVQQAYLEEEVQVLGREFKELQQGTIVLRRNQVIVASIVRVLNPAVAGEAVRRLLQDANETVAKAIQPGQKNVNQPVISMTDAEIERLINQIDDGQDYVVRIISAANYVVGEKQIRVFADAVVNKVVFQPGEVVAATSVDPQTMNPQQSRQQVEQLLQASTFRARHVGILGDTLVADGKIETIINFLTQLEQQNQPVVIRAVVADVTYTTGPLRLELVAIRNGQVVLQTNSSN